MLPRGARQPHGARLRLGEWVVDRVGGNRMARPLLVRLSWFAAVLALAGACDAAGAKTDNPGLASRDTVMTTVKPKRQDLANKVSLAGKVTLGPVFGLVSPVAGQVRYVDVKPVQGTPTKPTRVAIVVAKYGGYGIVADIDGGQAYQLSDSLSSVQAQIKNGPGPFPCTVLGTVAALPAGTIPEPKTAAQQPGPQSSGAPPGPTDGKDKTNPSDATGMRLVCTAPADVKLINGATATLEVITERATNVLVLPVEAVAGLHGKGKVDVVRPDGTRETRDVELGLTDGKVVQIKSGLTGDEVIAIPGPNLPAPKATDTGEPGGPGGPLPPR